MLYVIGCCCCSLRPPELPCVHARADLLRLLLRQRVQRTVPAHAPREELDLLAAEGLREQPVQPAQLRRVQRLLHEQVQDAADHQRVPLPRIDAEDEGPRLQRGALLFAQGCDTS